MASSATIKPCGRSGTSRPLGSAGPRIFGHRYRGGMTRGYSRRWSPTGAERAVADSFCGPAGAGDRVLEPNVGARGVRAAGHATRGAPRGDVRRRVAHHDRADRPPGGHISHLQLPQLENDAVASGIDRRTPHRRCPDRRRDRAAPPAHQRDPEGSRSRLAGATGRQALGGGPGCRRGDADLLAHNRRRAGDPEGKRRRTRPGDRRHGVRD